VRGVAKRSIIAAGLAAAALLAAGCSAVRLGYDQAPWITYRWVDGYADFDGAQGYEARQMIDNFFAWHRRDELPRYATLLARAQADARRDVTADEVCALGDQGSERVDAALVRMSAPLATVAAGLKPRQIDHIAERYDESNTKFRDEYLQDDLDDRRDASMDRAVERFEDLYGPITDAQRQLLADGIAASPFSPQKWFDERQARQQDVLQTARRLRSTAASAETSRAEMLALLQRQWHSPREPYRQYQATLRTYNCAFIARMHNATTPEQRAEAANRLGGWAEDARVLASEGSGSPAALAGPGLARRLASWIGDDDGVSSAVNGGLPALR